MTSLYSVQPESAESERFSGSTPDRVPTRDTGVWQASSRARSPLVAAACSLATAARGEERRRSTIHRLAVDLEPVVPGLDPNDRRPRDLPAAAGRRDRDGADVASGGTAGDINWAIYVEGKGPLRVALVRGGYKLSLARVGTDIVETDPVYNDERPELLPDRRLRPHAVALERHEAGRSRRPGTTGPTSRRPRGRQPAQRPAGSPRQVPRVAGRRPRSRGRSRKGRGAPAGAARELPLADGGEGTLDALGGREPLDARHRAARRAGRGRLAARGRRRGGRDGARVGARARRGRRRQRPASRRRPAGPAS